SRLDSYLGRINYGYKDKYFLDLTARVDGSSKFGENNKYGFFPAIAGAWRIVEEPFMKSVSAISDLKLRGSYGITGNAGAIDPYKSLATVSGGPLGLNYNYNHNPVTGINPSAIPNPDLKWERSTQVDVGLDVSLFNNRLSLVADYYNKRTDNLLFEKVLPMSSGYTFITGNFGSIQNRGVELAVNGRILPGGKQGLQWDASANITFNKNEVLALDGILDELPRSAFALLKIGYPMGLYRTYIFDGISQTGETILPGYDGRIGGQKVKDVNGDGTITAADQLIVGNSQPKYTFGFSSSFRYRGFDLNLFVQGVQGNKLMNLFRYTFETALGQQNVLAGMANRWSATNPSNEYSSGFQGGRLPISDRYVEDASFVRLKNVSLGYTL
ncbi:MAG: TonB-dependent receptor, partial [Cytophagaceae bacterium]